MVASKWGRYHSPAPPVQTIVMQNKLAAVAAWNGRVCVAWAPLLSSSAPQQHLSLGSFTNPQGAAIVSDDAAAKLHFEYDDEHDTSIAPAGPFRTAPLARNLFLQGLESWTTGASEL